MVGKHKNILQIKWIIRIGSILILIISLYKCEKIVSYPEVPEIWFKDFNYNTTTLTIEFIDGDGDIGHHKKTSQNDTINDTIQDFFIEYYKLTSTDTSLIEQYPYKFIIPYFTSLQGNNKTMKGTIEVKLSESIAGFDELNVDSFYIKFWIMDRAKHLSNTDSTPTLYYYDPNPPIL